MVGRWGVRQRRGRATGKPLRTREIEQARVALGVQEQVFRAQIAVNHASRVNALVFQEEDVEKRCEEVSKTSKRRV